eukprot:CAMPEP_0114558334 /NCGR_PEP_ID=MMETSP0114-20121206/10322_1 /TAXON_ID=31324 /ORGANISM="Goniomonas sp, Strain m" /LENGTH=321 /DNA_ID=CAMNT_0001743709 /DNA_START=101 /DNA_END=1066 /DNA_ORIENTATION=+
MVVLVIAVASSPTDPAQTDLLDIVITKSSTDCCQTSSCPPSGSNSSASNSSATKCPKAPKARKSKLLLKLEALQNSMKLLMKRQRHQENVALGIRREALRQWMEYKVNLDDAETIAKTSARYSKRIMEYATKAVKAKKAEMRLARSSYNNLKQAMRDVAKSKWKPQKKLTMHEKYEANADPIKDFEKDPFYEHRRKPTPLEKAEDELEDRVFSGTATRAEIKAYSQLNHMHRFSERKKRNTYMGEALEIVRRKYYSGKFNKLVNEAERHAKLASKYTSLSAVEVAKAKVYTVAQRKLLKKIKVVLKQIARRKAPVVITINK